MLRVALCLLFATSSVLAAPALPSYGARADMVSVSGISSGAYMSVQMHVTYSASIMGVGVVAGGPYYCARGSAVIALDECMATGNINVNYLVNTATPYAYNTGTIDATSNLANSKVYIFGGTLDSVAVQAVPQAAEEYYRAFVPATRIKTAYHINAEHAMVTENHGNSCAYKGMPYINDCNYNAAFEILQHTYGGLTRPTQLTPQNGDFLTFDQTEFFSGLNTAYSQSVANSGYVYVPSGCRITSGHCKVHLALHGCDQASELIGDEFARYTGYNEVAELNDIIIIYPQTISKAAGNPNGCWDWWGYNTASYASNLAPQMQFLKSVIDRAT